MLVPCILPKNKQKSSTYSTMIPQADFFSFVFRKNWRHQKVLSKLTDLYYPRYIWIEKCKIEASFHSFRVQLCYFIAAGRSYFSFFEDEKRNKGERVALLINQNSQERPAEQISTLRTYITYHMKHRMCPKMYLTIQVFVCLYLGFYEQQGPNFPESTDIAQKKVVPTLYPGSQPSKYRQGAIMLNFGDWKGPYI